MLPLLILGLQVRVELPPLVRESLVEVGFAPGQLGHESQLML
jgi:hypothetical protein